MFNINRICSNLIIFGIIILIPSSILITFLDELIAYSLLLIALADCIFNGCWRKYKLLWLITGLITFYAIYSACFLSYNTLPFIMLDWVIELKPFLPFCVLFAIGPTFTLSERKIIRIFCVINMAIVLILFLLGRQAIIHVLGHPAYGSQYAILCGTIYYLMSRDPETNHVSTHDIIVSLALMTIGIMGFKAKFFGVYILAIFLMTLYRPGILRHFNLSHALLLLMVAGLTLAATWNKIQYYFLTGNSDTFDPNAVMTFARPVLYAVGAMILVDHFPFGTGLASFATYASQQNYSTVYFEYGINNVFGLSPGFSAFICDAFYPSIAQFGFLGLVLFIIFWIYIYSFLRAMIRSNPVYFRPLFVAGSIFIIFNLVEATSSTTFTQTCGLITLALLGMICAQGKKLKSAQTSDHKTSLPIKI